LGNNHGLTGITGIDRCPMNSGKIRPWCNFPSSAEPWIPADYPVHLEKKTGIANPFASQPGLKKDFQPAVLQVTLIIIVGSTPIESI
jgi:hypothetical protein